MTAQAAPGGQDAARASIEQLLTDLSEAWNAGDADAYGELFTDDAGYITFFGKLLRGRADIVGAHRVLFAAIPGSRMTPGVKAEQEISFLGRHVALVVGTGASPTMPGRELTADRASTVSFVAVCQPQGWRFVHFQNTRITPMPNPLAAPHEQQP